MPEMQYRAVTQRGFNVFSLPKYGTGEMLTKLPGTILETAAMCLVLLALASAAPTGAGQAGAVGVTVEGGKVVGESDTFRFTEGEEIVILWTSDTAMELHVHGYDLTVPATPGRPAEMRFPGSIAGRFPVTSHGAAGDAPDGHRTLIYIEIYPE